MAYNLKGKVAIITGSGSGIGKGIAQVFSKEGVKVVVADFDAKTGQATADEIDASGGQATFVKVDVTSQAETENMAKEAINKYGKIDILINNAGIYPTVRIETMTDADWDKVMNINLKGGFHCVKAVMPEMMKNRYGRIVFTSSITGPRTSIYGCAHYAASKGGVNGLIHGLALELAKYNITVNGIEPGTIATPGLLAQLGDEWMRESAESIPVGRVGLPEDIAYAEMFLATDEASFITGQTLILDGGQLIPETKEVEHL